MKKYYRKSRKNYPDGVLGIYDNNGKSLDRYTIVYSPEIIDDEVIFTLVSMNGNPFHPQYGICVHSDWYIRYTRQNGEKCINFSDLPIDCQKVIERDLQENDTRI